MWIIEYRDLIQILTISDLRVKYQSSVLGFAWSLVNPLFIMIILYAVFSGIFHVSESRYALYILIGIITWRFLASGSSQGMTSIVANAGLVTKVAIPRQIIVFSTVLSAFISSILEFGVLFFLIIFFGVSFSSTFLLFPPIHMLYLLPVYAISIILASLYVFYRDLNQFWDILLQAGFFLSPIVYPISAVPEKYIQLYMLNPVTIIMEMYRGILLYGEFPPASQILYLVVISIILLLTARFGFSRLKRRFAEEV